MEQERIAPPAREAQTRKDAELFIHLRLETVGMAPWLAAEDVAQAAQTALRAQVRQHRCRVLALGCGIDHLHAVLQFPASLSLRSLVQVACEASSMAVAHALCVTGGAVVPPDVVWGGAYQLDTLSADDVAGVAAYVTRHPDMPTEPGLERADVRDAIGRRLAWARYLREGNGSYHPESDMPHL